jgi:hypothetical protein
MFTSDGIANLLKLPTDSGVLAAADEKVASSELLASPYLVRDKAVQLLKSSWVISPKENFPVGRDANFEMKAKALLKAHREELETLRQMFVPKVYMFNNTLIQVVYAHLDGGTFSISEEYFDLIENANHKVGPQFDKQASHKLNTWFKLGEFSYRINSAKVSKTVIGASDATNQFASALQDLVAVELSDLVGVGLDSTGAKKDESVRFLIVDYDVRNEGKVPVTVLTDDFRVEDAKGREFTTDSEVTIRLIETSTKPAIAEVLQPGIETHRFQGFRLPSDAILGPLAIAIPEKGLGNNNARVVINEDRMAGQYSLRPIESNLLRSIVGKTLERKKLPAGMRPLAAVAESGYYFHENEARGLRYNSELPLNWNDSEKRSRVFLNFTGNPKREADRTGWKYDPVYQVSQLGLSLSERAKRIREAIKVAETELTKLKKIDGF